MIHKPQKRLVNECRRLKHLVRLLFAKKPAGPCPQFGLNSWHHALSRRFISATQVGQ